MFGNLFKSKWWTTENRPIERRLEGHRVPKTNHSASIWNRQKIIVRISIDVVREYLVIGLYSTDSIWIFHDTIYFFWLFFFIYISSWYSLKGLFFCFLLLFLLFLPRHWYTRMNPTLDIVRFVNAVVLSHTQIVFFVYENRIGICVLKHKVFFCVQNSSF